MTLVKAWVVERIGLVFVNFPEREETSTSHQPRVCSNLNRYFVVNCFICGLEEETIVDRG